MGALDYQKNRVVYCGGTYKHGDKAVFPQNAECCPGVGKGNEFNDCDHKYYPTGHAFEDYVDFFRDEALWLRTFSKAWHVATENGL